MRVEDRADVASEGDPRQRARASRLLVERLGVAVLNYLGVVSVLTVLVGVLLATQPTFGTTANFINVLETNAVLLVVSIGLTYVLLAGGFDLSVGGVLPLSGVLLAALLLTGIPPIVSVIVVVLGAATVGAALNGVLIAKYKLSFFVVTLGTLTSFRGLALLVSNGQTQGLYDQHLIRTMSSGRIAGVPWSVVIAVGLLVGSLLVTRYTGFGRALYAAGGNAEAARIAGIDVVGVRVGTYAIASGCAGLAGVLEAGRLAAAAPTVAGGIELTAAAAVLLGGTSFSGGVGGMFGTFLGVLFLGVLSNGLTISGVSSFWQGLVTGLVLVLAVLLDRVRGEHR